MLVCRSLFLSHSSELDEVKSTWALYTSLREISIVPAMCTIWISRTNETSDRAKKNPNWIALNWTHSFCRYEKWYNIWVVCQLFHRDWVVQRTQFGTSGDGTNSGHVYWRVYIWPKNESQQNETKPYLHLYFSIVSLGFGVSNWCARVAIWDIESESGQITLDQQWANCARQVVAFLLFEG